ncbi:MAG: DUF4832 domain-containing protein [Bacteroidales bacterium]
MQRILSICLIFLGLSGVLSGQSASRITYVSNDSVLTNPERGFYRFSSVSSKTAYNTINLNTLLGYRDQGISVLFRYFYLENFSATEISGAYLAGMEEDFNTLRKAGMKAVIRFAYSESMVKPYGDAPIEIALRHIEQLKPLLQKHADVILVLQAGFIGAWGEWYYTSNYALSPGVIFPEHWAKRKALVDALLEALPEDRMVQLRTPGYKYKLLDGDTVPLQADQAYTSLPKARLAHHNDCFVASTDDYGTYDNIPKEKYYLERDSKYLMVGGETCNTCTPCSDCPNALAEMARFHWTTLNIDYHPGVLSGWRTQGCFETVVNKLGYRYHLIEGSFQQAAKPGGAFSLDLRLINTGFSNPVNPRKVELVLRNTSSGEEFMVDLEDDPRFWPLNDTIHLHKEFGLPQAIGAGQYRLFLSMPDPEFSLYRRPEYAIRFANNQVWEKETGLNDLQFQLQVDDNDLLPDYTGSQYFTTRTPVILLRSRIVVDGFTTDWKGIPDCSASLSDPARNIRVKNQSDSLFFMVSGKNLQSSFQLFIDADENITSGYNAWQWQPNGSDYLIENGILYKYTGIDHAWGWSELGVVSVIQSDSVIEFAFPLAALNAVIPGRGFRMAFVNDQQGIVQSSYLPLQNASFCKVKMLLDPVPSPGLVSWQGNNRLYWQGLAENNLYTVLQRAGGSSDFENIAIMPAQEITYLDNNLDSTIQYRYRIYQTDGSCFSEATETQSVYARGMVPEFLQVKVDGDSLDWSIVKPLATGFSGITSMLRAVNFGDSLYISIIGPSGENVMVFLDTDNNSSTGLPDLQGRGGYEFKISHDTLYTAGGDWGFSAKILIKKSGNFRETAVALQDIEFTLSSSVILAAFIGQHAIPDYSTEVIFTKFGMPAVPSNFIAGNSGAAPYTRIVLEWTRSTDATGYVIERSIDGKDHYMELIRLPVSTTFYHDNSVDTNHLYFYRIFAYNGIYRSAASWPSGGRPGLLTSSKSPSASLNTAMIVFPNPADENCQVRLSGLAPDLLVTIKLFDYTGREIMQVFRGVTQENLDIRLDLDKLAGGVYFLRAEGDESFVLVKKLIVQ